MRELVDERGERRLQRDAGGVVVDDFGLGDIVVVQAVALELVGGIGHAVEIRLHRVGLELGAVVELDALLELDGVDQPVLAHRVALGEHRDQLHVLVEAVQALVERLGHRLRQRVVGVVGIGGGERARRPRTPRPWWRRPGMRRERPDESAARTSERGSGFMWFLRTMHDAAQGQPASISTRRRCDAWRHSAPAPPPRAA